MPEFNPEDRFLRIAEVEHHTGLKKSTIYMLVSKGEFPSPISLGKRASGWLLSEVNQWKQERIALSRPNKESSTDKGGKKWAPDS